MMYVWREFSLFRENVYAWVLLWKWSVVCEPLIDYFLNFEDGTYILQCRIHWNVSKNSFCGGILGNTRQPINNLFLQALWQTLLS
jgi:hypothetical protein